MAAKCPINDWYIPRGTLGPGGIRGRRTSKDYFIIAFPHRIKRTYYDDEHQAHLLTDKMYEQIQQYVDLRKAVFEKFSPRQIDVVKLVKQADYDHPDWKYIHEWEESFRDFLKIDVMRGLAAGDGDVWVVSLDRPDIIDFIKEHMPPWAEIRKQVTC